MELTRELLERHGVWVPGDRRWQRRLRLLQSLWRQEQGLDAGVHPRSGGAGARPLGSRLQLPEAEERLSNHLTDTIREVVRDELGRAREDGKLFSAPRIYDDLLSSQPLCFNLFGELTADLGAATVAAQHQWPGRVNQVTGSSSSTPQVAAMSATSATAPPSTCTWSSRCPAGVRGSSAST